MLNEYVHCRPEQLKEAIKECPLAFVPFGAWEWHSLHLPLGLDGLKAEALLKLVASQMNKGVIFPCVYWGCYDTLKFPNTFHFPRNALQSQVTTFVEDLYTMGFRVVVLLTGHYPGTQIHHFRTTALKMMKKHDDYCVLGIPEQDILMDLEYFGDHAAKFETSLGLHLLPKETDISQLPDNFSYIDRVKEFGVFGKDPKAEASKELGKKLTDAFVTRMQGILEETLKTGSQIPFINVYKNRDIAMHQLKNVKKLDKMLEVLGMKEKKDLVRHAKWMLTGSKPNQTNQPE